MSNIASSSLRQASRLCLKPSIPSAGALRANTLPRAAASAQRSSRRAYVSETKKDNAQVNVDTAIRAEQKAFFKETGVKAETQSAPGTSVAADAMMSPMAGMYLHLS